MVTRIEPGTVGRMTAPVRQPVSRSILEKPQERALPGRRNRAGDGPTGALEDTRRDLPRSIREDGEKRIGGKEIIKKTNACTKMIGGRLVASYAKP